MDEELMFSEDFEGGSYEGNFDNMKADDDSNLGYFKDSYEKEEVSSFSEDDIFSESFDDEDNE